MWVFGSSPFPKDKIAGLVFFFLFELFCKLLKVRYGARAI